MNIDIFRDLTSSPTGPVALSRFLRLAFVSQVLLAIPYCLVAWLIGASVGTLFVILVGPFLFLGAPLIASISWLIAKGSNWSNTRYAALGVAGYGSMAYATFSLILVALRYGSALPGWFYVVALVVLAVGRKFLLLPYGGFILGWLAPELLLPQGKTPPNNGMQLT